MGRMVAEDANEHLPVRDQHRVSEIDEVNDLGEKTIRI